MPVRKVPHKKPNAKDKAKVYIVGNDRIDIVAQTRGNNKNISCIQRLNKNEMINTVTGEITKRKTSKYKKENDINSQMSKGDKIVSANFKGKPSEKLLELHFSVPVPDFKEATDLFGNFFDRLKRKYGNLDFIRVTMFEEEDLPFFQVWTKTQDNTDFNITDEELDKIWGEGKSKVIEITPNNLERLIKYDWRSKTALLVYPSGIQIISKSKGIRDVEVIQEDYEKSSKRTKGHKLKYKSTKEVYDIDRNGKEKVFKTITFESYRRIKKTIKLGGIAGHKEYKSKKKIADKIEITTNQDTEEEVHETQPKAKAKAMRVIEQENNILFAEIGRRSPRKNKYEKGR